MKTTKTWKPREKRILKTCFKRHSQIEEIKFLIPKTPEAIETKISSLRLGSDKRRKLVYDDYFKDVRSSKGKTKWLGFLFYRATVKGKILSIFCHSKYQTVLEEMNRDLGSTYKIHKYKNRNRICLRIRSKSLCEKLKSLGLTDKIKKRTFPSIPRTMDKSFMQGMKFKLLGSKKHPIK